MNIKLIISFVLGTTFLLIVALFTLSFFDKTNTPQVTTYTKSESQKPKVDIPETFGDLGNISVKDLVTKDFIIKNRGDKILQLSNVNSNCGCTSAKIISNGVETKESGMHKVSSTVTEIAPGADATISVIYRPLTMPVYGVVFREVYIDTNDPDLPKLVLRIKANVN